MLSAIGQEYHDPLTDAERQVGKTGNFAAIYSGGVPTIQRQLGCTNSVARQLADAFHERYPLLGRWKWEGRGFSDPGADTLNGQICSRLRERGYITTLWGRHLHPLEDRKALNALVQGGAADLMKASMVRLARAFDYHGLQSHMVLSVHDEIGFDVREEELSMLLELVPQEMCAEPMLTEVIPLAVDMKASYENWADAKEVECLNSRTKITQSISTP
jgi:DNA polymerase-1